MQQQAQTFNPSGGIILVQAKINSPTRSGTARLVFDTGATHCMLPWRLIKELDLEIDTNRVVSTTTASSVETSPLISLPSVEVLGQKAEKVTCIVRDMPPLSGIDGLLGLSFLKHFRVEIDFEQGELTLWDER